MRLDLLINSSFKFQQINKKAAKTFHLSKKVSNMASADEKPPIGAILVNVPNETSDTVDIQDTYKDYVNKELMDTISCTRQHSVISNTSTKASVQQSTNLITNNPHGGYKRNTSMDTKITESMEVNLPQEGSRVSFNTEPSLDIGKGKARKSVLPKNLLDSVTDLIRQQKSKHSAETTNCTSETVSLDISTVEQSAVQISNSVNEKLHIKTEDRQNMIDLESIPKVVVDITKRNNELLPLGDNTTNTDKCVVDTPGHSTELVSSDILIGSPMKTEYDESDTEKDLLFPNLIDETLPKTIPEEDVFDISTLFTGELERRCKREKKKAGKWKRFKNKKKKHNKEGNNVEEENDADVKNKLRPNYFVSIKITNKKIHEALNQVQEEVLKGNLLLSSAMIKLDKLHLTLMVLRIDTEDEMKRAKKALENTMDNLIPTYCNKTLTFGLCGLGNFRNEIVFAMIKDKVQTEEIEKIASVVECSFFSHEFLSTEDHGFKPHVTVMKMSKGKSLRKKGIKKIDPSLYEKYKSTEFGEEQVTRLQLCSMMKTDTTGYYLVEHEVYFPQGQTCVDDSGFEDNSLTDKEGPTETESTHTDSYCSDDTNQSKSPS